jgi:ankyrin repeat protein
MQAAYWNNESVARWLFTHGADPFVRNASNQTALDVAMNERNINVAEIVRLRMGELEAAKRAVGSARSTKPIDIAAATKAQQLH